MNLISSTSRCFVAVLFFALVAPVSALTLNNWSVTGFGTLGTAGTDTDALTFHRDITSSSGATTDWAVDVDSRLGLQLDADLSQPLHFGMQYVARNRAGDFFEQNLEWFYLRWRTRGDTDVRVGRLAFDGFMLSDYRHVGYAYPWMRPPHEFYANQPIYHFDGIDISHPFSLNDGVLTLKGFAGHAFWQFPFGPTVADSGNALAGIVLQYEKGPWRARTSYVYSQQLRNPLDPQVLSALEAPAVNAVWPGANSLVSKLREDGGDVQYASVGLGYDDGLWQLQGEAGYLDSTLGGYPSFASAYLSAGRRFGKLTAYTLLGFAESFEYRVTIPQPLVPVPEILALRGLTDTVLNHSGIDQKSVSLGVRWDCYKNVALKAQWTHNWIGEDGRFFWIPTAQGNIPSTVNVWSFGIDFMF